MNNDLISREALQESHSKECIHNCYYCKHYKWSSKKACGYCDVIDNAQTAMGWIPIKTREMTDEEKERHPESTFMWDCPLPDDAQDVLISTSWGDVKICTFCVDEYGSYFDEMDEDDVLAWMPLPEPYTKEDDNG